MKFKDVYKTLSLALKEDIGSGDITTCALFPAAVEIRARIIAREDGVVCGLPVAKMIFAILDKKIIFKKNAKEGAAVKKGQVICTIRGRAQGILAGERVALNFLSRLSGIATITRLYARRIAHFKTKLMDTRKTTPGMRQFEKYAVSVGGGHNHRMGLWDQVLIKDNHIASINKYISGYRGRGTGYRKKIGLNDIVHETRKKVDRGIKIEIEVDNLRQFREALKARPDIIMLDNMKIPDIKKAVLMRNRLTTNDQRLTTKLEASGGIMLKNVRAVAKTGVDIISTGALTHSAPALDFSLEVV